MRMAISFQQNLNNPLAVSIGPDWWLQSMPGSGCLSNDERFKSTNLQAGSFLLITMGDSLAQSALNLSWLIYSPAHPGHISNAGPGSTTQPLTAGWADWRSSARIAEAATATWTCHVGSAQFSSDHNGVVGDVLLGEYRDRWINSTVSFLLIMTVSHFYTFVFVWLNKLYVMC